MTFAVLPGLPPYGDPAISFPSSFGGREGLVVEFTPQTGSVWVGNFAEGIGGYTGVHAHPNGIEVVVFSEGNCYVVDPETGSVREDDVPGVIAQVWLVRNPDGFILDRQGLAFERLSAEGIVWHSRRLSWDGFRNVTIENQLITGEAWSPVRDAWMPFTVDIRTGESEGGAFMEMGGSEWERLAR
jgi:hypothetical protein